MKKLALIALGLFAPFAIAAFGQTTNATLSGTVLDPQGAVIPNASVVATQIDTGQDHKAQSSSDGQYIISNLPIGRYRLSAEAPGFKKLLIPSIVLQVNQLAEVDLKLAVGAATEQVTVTEEAPLISTEDSSIGQVVQQQSIESTPLNGRNFWQLIALVPGASYTPGGQGTATGGSSLRASVVNVQINGTGSIWNGWRMDGSDITEYEQGGTNIQPNVDALSEFKVFSANMPAEYGQSPDVVSVTMKSGTNSLHGTVYEFLRNDIIDAHNYFATTSKNVLKRNQFGGTLGGPIRKNKLFYFLDLEESRQLQGITFSDIVPTDAERTGDFSGSTKTIRNPFTGTPFAGNMIPHDMISSQAQFFLPFMPTTSQATFNANQVLNITKGDIKVDAVLTGSDHLLARYSIADNHETDPNQFPALKTQDLTSRAQNFAFNETHTFGSRWLNEATASYYRDYFVFGPILGGTNYTQEAGIAGFQETELSPSFPYISLSGYSSFNGSGTGNFPKSNRIRTWQYGDTLSYTSGKNDIRFGGQMWVQRHSFYNGQYQEGQFGFSTQFTGDAFADYLLGLPATVGRAYPLTLFGNRAIQWAAFFQDNYRVNSRLTLNLGFRWEYNPFYRGINSQTSAFEPSTRTGFNPNSNGKIIIPTDKSGHLLDPTAQPVTSQLIPLFTDRFDGTGPLHLPESIRKTGPGLYVPRLGFAFRPMNDEKTVIRGAFGMYPVFLDTNMALQWAKVPPITSQQSLNNPVPAPVFVNSPATGEFFWSNPFQFVGSSLVAPNPNPGQPCTGSSWPGGVGPMLLSCVQPAISSASAEMNHTMMYQYSLAVQRQLFKEASMTIAYTGNRTSHNQLIDTPENVPEPGPGNIQSRRPFPQWGVASIGTTMGIANYNALQATFEKRLSSGVYALVSYAWSKCLDNGSVESSPPSLELLHRNYGPCSYDIASNLTVSSVYQLPLGKGHFLLGDSGRVMNAIVSGWEFAGVLTDHTGQPFTPTLSSDVANTGISGEWPNRIGSGKLSHPTRTRWFDTSAFTIPAQYTYGDSGRDILRADGLVDVDATLKKTFGLGESQDRKLEFRFESFNVANHPTFSTPNATIGSSSAGKVTGTLNANRIFQVAGKFYF
ncbi:TonB-dependent receptor [Paracidobacterium acidisoli]|uniref:TonB-dependent receptor n=1 Tax=Paracidobacterium acidisoli TaxID=2303751 RepID=A0A372ILQ1_9BACT|nr:TonB-dependent receptor [Paracidobacterium acidisoli]MBT9332414.1 TonB-dependent receptor [Paracidobacterium acidisoli]